MEREELSLLELNLRIREAVSRNFRDACWVKAEMSDVRLNASGHCYLEFVEKDAQSGQMLAKARASIWANTFRQLKPYFEKETGQAFVSGLKVLVRVSVQFHELYGFSLTVQDIDPAYTLGDMQRRRQEIVRRLKEEGIYALNQELPFPALPQRIAIISSASAAGYEDFIGQLANNKAGYPFYTRLFPAVMQGDRTEASILEALGRIERAAACFDVVVIIRGGGATSDLNCFDSYPLAARCAQFPLPVITGIGHERDDTVLDLVASRRLKTPTAVAEFLIGCMDHEADGLERLRQALVTLAANRLLAEKSALQALSLRLPSVIVGRIEQNRTWVQQMGEKLRYALSQHIAEQQRFLQLTEQFVRMASPDYILKRGYSLTLKAGKIVKTAADLRTDDTITTRFSDGEIESKVI